MELNAVDDGLIEQTVPPSCQHTLIRGHFHVECGILGHCQILFAIVHCESQSCELADTADGEWRHSMHMIVPDCNACSPELVHQFNVTPLGSCGSSRIHYDDYRFK